MEINQTVVAQSVQSFNCCSLGEFREMAKSRIIDQPEMTKAVITEAKILPSQPGKSELVKKLEILYLMRTRVPRVAWTRFVKRVLRHAGSTFAPFDNYSWELPEWVKL